MYVNVYKRIQYFLNCKQLYKLFFETAFPIKETSIK
jgi:hypothetical protein